MTTSSAAARALSVSNPRLGGQSMIASSAGGAEHQAVPQDLLPPDRADQFHFRGGQVDDGRGQPQMLPQAHRRRA